MVRSLEVELTIDLNSQGPKPSSPYSPTVNSKKLERPCPHVPKGILKGIPALIVLNPCSNFLEFTGSPEP